MKGRIQEDIKLAMKAKEQEKLATLRLVLSEIKNAEINTRTELDEAGAIQILQREVKKRREALQFAEDAKREDLAGQNIREIAILQSYLGDQMGDEKLREIISGLIAGGADNIGKIMGALNKDYKGKFEGKRASEIIRELLG